MIHLVITVNAGEKRCADETGACRFLHTTHFLTVFTCALWQQTLELKNAAPVRCKKCLDNETRKDKGMTDSEKNMLLRLKSTRPIYLQDDKIASFILWEGMFWAAGGNVELLINCVRNNIIKAAGIERINWSKVVRDYEAAREEKEVKKEGIQC